MGYYLHHRRLHMCGGCLSSAKEMTKDAEETCSVVCSCCKALIQISFSCELRTHILGGKKDNGLDNDTSSDGATKVMMLMYRRRDVKLQTLELGLAKAHLVIRETIQTNNVLVGPVYWNAYAFQRLHVQVK
ncbi:uncharacterized protein [Triticum aestivum]|uniref:uncharacterized protein n=1 Tax=Triticum aestivum TaxID=4565 RepID=UPI001D01767C|nr:uncharacterized protein LOC123069907 [Triticum aestivum]